MTPSALRRPSAVWRLVACGLLLGVFTTASAQTSQRTSTPLGPPDAPLVFSTTEQPRIRVVPVATGLSHPWGLAFRSNGDILVTERNAGALRVIRDGVLDPTPIPGLPEVFTGTQLTGLMDIAVHPEDDGLVYLTYSKPVEYEGRSRATVALARGRLDSAALTEVRDVFVVEPWGGTTAGSRIVFGPDGMLYMTVGGAFGQQRSLAQDPSSHVGKTLRLREDGTAPADNPFVGWAGYKPEIFTFGHRNQLGLAIHPETGAPWASEHGVQGGDEVNVLLAGRNYGWPDVSYSREYAGPRVTERPWQEGMEQPVVYWVPSIGPSGLTFYTGARFPAWRGNLFAGGMTTGRIRGTGHLERLVFNRNGEELRREWLLADLKQRIRDVRQGPDGFLYVLTDEDDAVLLRIEPAQAIPGLPGSIVPAARLTDARVPPLPETEWTDEQRALVQKHAGAGDAGNALRTLVRVPALADRVFSVLGYVANESTLSPRHRMLLVLRTAWLTQSANLWASFASGASEAGLTDDDVRRVAAGRLSEEWSELERTLIRLPDELFRNSSVTDRTWDALATEYDLYNMMDAVVTVGEIITRAILFNTLGIQPDADTTVRIPTNDIGYRVVARDREPPLTTPRIEPAAGNGLRVTRTFGRHARMAAARSATPGYVLNPERSRLTPHDRELLILRTGWNTRAVYEWAKHVGSVGRARAHGLDPVWIAQGRDQAGWPENELALIDAADEMYRDSFVSDDTWTRLAEHYDTHQLMSVVMAAARYRMVSLTLNAFGVQPLPDDERFPILKGY